LLHRDRIRVRRQAYLAEQADRIRERKRAYNATHQEEIRATSKAYLQKNAERERKRKHEYHKAHPEVARRSWFNRRAKLRGAGGSFSIADERRVFGLQKGCCWWCGEKLADTYHRDHRVPLSRGGRNDASNVVLSCGPCNLSKAKRLPEEWCGRLL